MLQISRQQILDRYDTLPESLKDAGFLPYNTLLIKKIGESNHLTGEKISTISQLVGYTLFGFIHTEDLAKEIKTELNIAPEIANSVAQEIDRKIFTPIRTDLEKVYQPPTEEALDLRAKVEPPTEVEMPKAEPIAVEISKAEEQKIVPVEEKKEIQYQEVQPPKINGQYGEEEGPVIIHKEVEFKPLSGTKKSLGGLFGFLRKDREEEKKISPVKAQVEMGEDAELRGQIPRESALSQRESAPKKVRVVHYTEFQPAVSPFPTETEKPKVETEGKIEIKPLENLPVVSPSTLQQVQGRPEQSRGATELRASPVEPPVVSRAEPPIEKSSGTISQGQAFQPQKIEIEKKPIAEEVPAPKTEPVLDLRKAAEPIKPAPEKPISPTPPPVSPAKPEAKGPAKEDEEIINLRMFK